MSSLCISELLKAQAAGTVVVQGISADEVEEMRKNQEAEVIVLFQFYLFSITHFVWLESPYYLMVMLLSFKMKA